jgi:hypothetical protein
MSPDVGGELLINAEQCVFGIDSKPAGVIRPTRC